MEKEHYDNSQYSESELGRTLIIPSEAKLSSGIAKIEFSEKTYELNIGIGKDHTAVLLIGEEALQELKKYKNDVTIDV